MPEHYSYTDLHDMMWKACKNVRRLRGKVPLEQILAGYYTKNQIETVLPTEDEEDFKSRWIFEKSCGMLLC